VLSSLLKISLLFKHPKSSDRVCLPKPAFLVCDFVGPLFQIVNHCSRFPPFTGLLQKMQSEWDAVMLESFTLKKHLDSTRQELSHVLYQNDAACRVIARLQRENANLRQALGDTKANMAGAIQTKATSQVAAATGLTEEITAHLTGTAKSLTTTRKQKSKSVPAELASAAQIGSYHCVSTSQFAAAATALDVHGNQVNVVVGGVDGAASVYDRNAGKIVERLEGHKQALTSVKFHPTDASVLTTSADHTASFWRAGTNGKYAAAFTVKSHTASVVGGSMHPTGSYFVTVSADKTWAFHDCTAGVTRLHVAAPDASQAPYSCVSFHPDGLILGTGCADGSMKIWDVVNQTNVHTFEPVVNGAATTAIAFSENGFYCATADAQGNVSIWDLRKLKSIKTFTAADCGAVASSGVCSLDFDFSGQYLAVGCGNGVVRIFGTKEWNSVASWSDATAPVTGVKFGAHASYVAATSGNVLRVYGTDAMQS
jgi:pre-mRNA-processing factor 19